MKNLNRNLSVGRTIFIFMIIGLFAVACASSEQKAAPAPQAAAIPAPPPVPSKPDKRVMFDFDSSIIKTDQEIQSHIVYMKANTSTQVSIEGHSDSHGPDEYNVGLGEKRAKSVEALMLENGIDASRISIMSHGESKPAIQEENRAAWAQNRRVEFVYAK